MILYVNACVRENSRTEMLAKYLLSGLEGTIQEVRLAEYKFPIADQTFLEIRDELIAAKKYTSPIFEHARFFAKADTIVIAAPYWDLSFPAALKQYLEQINVLGITFRYTEEGIPQTLCKAEKLYYITTAGGTIFSDGYGYGYVEALAKFFYQIPEVYQIKAEGLDMVGADVSEILSEAKQSIDHLIGEKMSIKPQ